MTIGEAFERFIFDEIKLRNGADKTARNYSSVLNSFVTACGDVPVELITYDTIIRWKMYMDSTGNQPSSMSSSLSKLRQVFRYLIRHSVKVIDPRDIELPKVFVKEAEWLTVKEIRAMLDSASSLRDKALISALFSSGGRVSEVLSLDRDSIQNNKAQVVGKGSKLITLYFDDSAMKHINAYLESRSDKLKPLFISGQYRRITVSRVEQIMHILAGEAVIEKNVTPHVFRHSFATDLLTNGADVIVAKELLNHSSVQTTQRYLHVATSRKEQSYAQKHTKL